MPLKGSIKKATPKQIEEARAILEKRKTKKIVETEETEIINP